MPGPVSIGASAIKRIIIIFIGNYKPTRSQNVNTKRNAKKTPDGHGAQCNPAFARSSTAKEARH